MTDSGLDRASSLDGDDEEEGEGVNVIEGKKGACVVGSCDGGSTKQGSDPSSKLDPEATGTTPREKNHTKEQQERKKEGKKGEGSKLEDELNGKRSGCGTKGKENVVSGKESSVDCEESSAKRSRVTISGGTVPDGSPFLLPLLLYFYLILTFFFPCDIFFFFFFFEFIYSGQESGPSEDQKNKRKTQGNFPSSGFFTYKPASKTQTKVFFPPPFPSPVSFL